MKKTTYIIFILIILLVPLLSLLVMPSPWNWFTGIITEIVVILLVLLLFKEKKKKKSRDRDFVACNEDHEMAHICKKYGKKASKKNIQVMRTYCKSFKKDKRFKTHNRKTFYKFLESNKKAKLKKLEA